MGAEVENRGGKIKFIYITIVYTCMHVVVILLLILLPTNTPQRHIFLAGHYDARTMKRFVGLEQYKTAHMFEQVN